MTIHRIPDAVEGGSPEWPPKPLADIVATRAAQEAPEAVTGERSGPHGATQPHTRPWTPDRITINAEGRKVTTMTLKHACNGCDQTIGDATEAEIWRAVEGLPAEDVRAECPNCKPLVALEAAGCRTWRLTVRSYARVANEVDRLRPWVFSKGYWQEVDGENQVVGLRVGEYPDHVVAFFGDTLVRHPDGQFTVHKAPEAVTA
jgi:hypothetical protein